MAIAVTAGNRLASKVMFRPGMDEYPVLQQCPDAGINAAVVTKTFKI